MTRFSISEADGCFHLAARIEETMPSSVFSQRELHTSPQTWEAVLKSLLSIYSPETLKLIEITAEPDFFFVRAQSRAPLETAAELLEGAMSYRQVLLSAIENAGPALMCRDDHSPAKNGRPFQAP